MTAFEDSVDRTVVVLARQLEHGTLTRAWEFDLARWLELSRRPSLVELIQLWNHLVRGTKEFPDGPGPWGAHPVWGEETYGIGHTRNCLRVFADEHAWGDVNLFGVPRWIQRQQQSDGHFACEAEFERLYRERNPEWAARRDAEAAWRHSDLEDAWNAIDALQAVETPLLYPAQAVEWLQAQQQADGSFRASASALTDTMHATCALAALGSSPRDPKACMSWLMTTPVADDIVAQWTRIEAMCAMGLRPNGEIREMLDSLAFTTDEDASQVSFEAWAALRARRLVVGDET